MTAPTPLSEIRQEIRAIALAFALSAFGMLVAFLIKKAFLPGLTRLGTGLIAFPLTATAVLLVFPRRLGMPFGRISPTAFLSRLHLNRQSLRPAFILPGVLCALFSLGGMLIGSLMAGGFSFRPETLSWGQAVFSLTPGVWEEVLFRGIILLILLRRLKSWKTAALRQVLIFTLGHVKSLDLFALLDLATVGLLGWVFTYLVLKTGSLIPAIITHTLHDALLFTVQLPEASFQTWKVNLFFYGNLWLMLGFSVVAIKLLSERFSWYNSASPFYRLKPTVLSETHKIRAERMGRRIALLTGICYLGVLFPGLDEYPLPFVVFIGFYALGHLILFLDWNRWQGRPISPAHLLDALMSFASSAQAWAGGSRRLWLVLIPLGFMFLIQGIAPPGSVPQETAAAPVPPDQPA